MNKRETLAYAGSIEQIAHIRPVTFAQARADGLRGLQVKNGALDFLLLPDKCMDVAALSYKGVNLSFLSKPGLTGRGHFDTNGKEAVRSIMGGMLFTCGLDNICVACESGGVQYPMHGRIRSTPADHVGYDAYWENDEKYVLEASGEMRQAELFGENLLLRRQIRTVMGEKSFCIRDEIENLTFREEAMSILYHWNAGYPLLAEGAKVIMPSKSATPRDAAAQKDKTHWSDIPAPIDNEPEYCFLHELAADEKGDTFAALINDALGLGVLIEFNKKYLPRFIQWKCMASGDYALGLEPCNASVFGRAYQTAHEEMHTLAPFAKEVIEMKCTVLEGAGELGAVRRRAEDMLG